MLGSSSPTQPPDESVTFFYVTTKGTRSTPGIRIGFPDGLSTSLSSSLFCLYYGLRSFVPISHVTRPLLTERVQLPDVHSLSRDHYPYRILGCPMSTLVQSKFVKGSGLSRCGSSVIMVRSILKRPVTIEKREGY